MEQEENKRRITTQSSLPLDLTSEILLRLPAKSVVRFRCVSKLWSSIITDLHFIKSFQNHSSTRPRILLCFKKGDKLFVFSIPQPQKNSDSYSSQHVDRYHMTYPKDYLFSLKKFVPGQIFSICFRESGKPIIWNPTMRKFLILPLPENSSSFSIDRTVFLGYDPMEGKHKLVSLTSYISHQECRILTLGSDQETWRTITTTHEHIRRHTYGRCINGVMYYNAYDQMDVSILMSFDVRSEKFYTIKLPQGYTAGILISYEGKVASVCNTDMGGIDLWILEDAEKHEWSYKYFAALKNHDDQSLKTIFKVKGITDAGEFIYVPCKFVKSFYILYYDPKRKRFRKVEFEVLGKDDEYMVSNGLGNISMFELHTIPNHIENLMSF